MSKSALFSAGLLLAIVAGPAWAKEGTVVHNPDGTWGCVDEKGNPIPAGANGRWEGKLVVGSPCKPATARVVGQVDLGGGTAPGGTRPSRAIETRAAASAAAPVLAAAQMSATAPEAAAPEAAPISFDAKGSAGLVVEPAGKSISEKGVSSTKSR